jgi:hypothetical protein
MVFIPRDPVMQNQFLVHDSSQGDGTETAGSVVYLSGDELVAVVSGVGNVPYGFLMQNVKAESSAHPTGFRLPGDLGSSDAFTGDPVAVAHYGIYDTTYYDTADTYTAGDWLGVSDTGRVSKTNMLDIVSTVSGGTDYVAIAQNTLGATAVAAGTNLRIKLLC